MGKSGGCDPPDDLPDSIPILRSFHHLHLATLLLDFRRPRKELFSPQSLPENCLEQREVILIRLESR